MDKTNPFEVVGVGADERTGNRAGGVINNGPNTLPDPYTGRVLLKSPFVLAQEDSRLNFTGLPNLNFFLSEPVPITTNPVLQDSCLGDSNGTGSISLCHEVRPDANNSPLGAVEARWGFDANSDEFAQVNTFYHQKKLINGYHTNLLDYITNVADPSGLNFKTSLPSNMYTTGAHFYQGRKLKTYAVCPEADNASFDPSDFSICLGFSSLYPSAKVAHDPSVLIHELGHTLTQVQLNMRTIAKQEDFPFRSEIGYRFYDESSGINEGVADFYSHAANNRDAVFEYIFNNEALTGENGLRPVIEDHPFHAEGISTADEDRLSYPDFITYLPDNPQEKVEDVHFSGMIASHFLVALKKDIETYCQKTHEDVGPFLTNLLTESYAYLGDLSSTGNDFSTDSNVNHIPNLDSSEIPLSVKWYSLVRPITFKSFFQTFSRFMISTISKDQSTLCNGTFYPKDRLEKLLDNYGLLLFNNYNEDGNNYEKGHDGPNTTINQQNRLKSIMVSKDLIKLDERTGKAKYFIFDKGSDIRTIVEALLSRGQIRELSDQTDPSLSYNNGNGEISPGEVVGISLNIYNDSNTAIGGVQVLANDWDHGKMDNGFLRPCGTLSDQWPSENEGGQGFDEGDNLNRGDCGFVTRDDGLNTLSVDGNNPQPEYLTPVCFVQMSQDNATYWGAQEEYAESIGLEKRYCLGGEENPKDCIIRAIPGADTGWFSKIDPNATWGESLPDENGNAKFGLHNITLFEVNKNIVPGTKFMCRLRARFTNCKDCFFNEDEYAGDDYLDYEFSGEKPFKILSFEFTVVD